MSKLSRLKKSFFKRDKKVNDIISSERLNGIEILIEFWDESQYEAYFQQRMSKRQYRGTLTFAERKKLRKVQYKKLCKGYV